jgi:predicted aspartyl protease
MSLEQDSDEYDSDEENKRTFKRMSYDVFLNGEPLTILIDSGSESNYVSATTAIRLQLPAYKKKRPYRLRHAKGENF